MAITATFAADFSQFNGAVKAATDGITTFGGGALKAEDAIKGLEKTGSTLGRTFTGLDTSGSTLGRTFTTTETQSERLRGSLQKFDGVLASLGFSIGPQIKAVEEIGTAAGKTASEIGAIGTAGLVVGAGVAGWQVGRMIADFFKLDEAIGGATAKLLGFGDVAGETAGAKQDSINAAISRGAAATITYAEALEFNTRWFKKHQEESAASAKALKTVSDAMVELNSVGLGWQGTLETISGTVVEAIKYYLQAGVAQGTLADAYGLTTAQVKAVASALEAETVALTRLNDEQERWDSLLKAIETSMADKAKGLDILYDKTVRQTEASLAEYDAHVKLNEAYGLDAQGHLKVASAAETLRLGLEALHAKKVEGISQTNQEKVLTDAYTEALRAEAAAQDRATFGLTQVAPAAATAAAGVNGLTASYWAAVDAAAALAGIPDIGHRAPSINDPGFASPTITGGGLHPLSGTHPLRAAGGPVDAGRGYVVGERGPELFVPNSNGTIVPNGAGKRVVNYIYVNGTAEDVARKVASEIMRTMMSGGKMSSS